MPPQRRKYKDVCKDDYAMDVEEPVSKKRVKNSIQQSFYNSRRSSKSNSEYNDSANFNQKRCLTLFNEYASAEDPEVIGPEGIESFCHAISVDPEDPVMLVVSWKMDAKQMGYFTKKEWLKGLTELQCDSIAKIRAKIDHLRALMIDPSVFKSVYRFAFDFSKDRDQRNIDLETARPMLALLLGKQWAMHPYFDRFLEQSKYKVINKDQWSNVLEFSRTVSTDLSNYDEDGAWPVLLDEFVEWYRKNVLAKHSTIVDDAITID